ncbi:MAG: outer membrane protein transport protein [Bacteroidales bacterium]|nr:outer membrane protein transport protein [Bacteroidales bacterium]
MKHLTIVAAMLGIASAAMAEGYQVNTFSAKQEGMGHVGVGMKLGSESVIFNPGALTFMDKTMEISGAVSAISSHVDCYYNGSTYETSNKVSTPMIISAAWRIYDNFYAGVSFYTPYGSSINWGRNWPGAALNQSVDLKIFTVQPTLSWRIIPKLSVGAGLMITWGNVDLNKGLVSGSSFGTMLGLLGGGSWNESVSPASANLTGSSEIALGVNVGAMYDINKQWTVGASFRSKMKMHVKSGDVTVEYANETAQALLEANLQNLNYTNFDASMPCPYVLTAGVSYKPIEKLILAFDLQLNGWKAYDYLDITFAEQEAFNQHLKKDYKNTLTYHLGAQYAVTPRCDLRCGLMIDTSPCNKDYYNPETPGTTRIEPSVGLSFSPLKGLSVDLAFMYVYGTKAKNCTGEYDDFIAKTLNSMVGTQILPTTGTFTADYKLHAVIPAIGVSYSF